MSLLIKALDQAAKSKAVDEKNKVKNSPKDASPTLLELEPVTKTNRERYALSLAEEAGIAMPNAHSKANRQSSRTSAKDKATDGVTKNTPQGQDKSKSPQVAVDLIEQDVQIDAINESTYQTPPPLQESKLPPVFKDMEIQGAMHQANSAMHQSDSAVHQPNSATHQAHSALNQTQSMAHQKAAASVFKANDEPKRQSSWLALILLSVAGALTLWLVWQGYLAMKSWLKPDVAIASPSPILSTSEPANTTIDNEQNADFQNVDSAFENNGLDSAPLTSEVTQLTEVGTEKTGIFAGGNDVRQTARSDAALRSSTASVESSSDKMTAAVQKMNQVRETATLTDDSTVTTPLTLIRKTPADAVEPAVLAAYNAFQRGDYATSQQQYRLALQQDTRNIDALLGMAAVAQKQNRFADANGWYQKVLEIAPRNTIALTAITSLQVNQDAVASESRLKSLIAQQPSAAHLYAALGHLYATKQQWSDAQDAYFNASRLSPNMAEYAFNVAVSLEHLNKSQLALVQYERTLSLINSTDAISPNRQIVEARIQALQP